MTEVSGLTDLIPRLEREGGSRELDAAIMRVLGQDPAGEYLSHYEPIPWEQQKAMMRNRAPRVEAANPVFKTKAHPYTTSLDAAIALCERVLPDGIGDVMVGPRVKYRARMSAFTQSNYAMTRYTAWANNPATALCIALLRALEDGK